MAIAKNRLLMMLYLLSNSEDPLKAQNLAVMTGVSVRTVKNDMNELRSLALASGAEIITRKGRGYQLKVRNQEVYQPVLEQLQIRFHNTGHEQSEMLIRTNDIARCLVAANDYMTLDEVADQLYLSRRTLQAEFREVRRTLEQFGLKLQTRPRYGVKVDGDEFQRRLCMLELYENHYYKAMSFLNYNEYAQNFDADDQERNDIRHIFLRVLRESGNTIRDIYTNRIAWYLILMRNRIRSGHSVMLPARKACFLKSFGEYHIAQRCLQELAAAYSGFEVEESEVLALEIILLCWNDLLESDDLQPRYSQATQRAGELAVRICESLRESWGIDFTTLPECMPALRPLLVPMLFCDALDFRYQIHGVHVDSNGIRYSPLCCSLALDAIRVLQQSMQVPLTEMDVNALAVAFYYLLDKVPFHYRKRRILICSRNGRMASEIIRQQILRRYHHDYFESIDIYEFYEVRGLDQSRYDYLLLNYPTYSYHYTIPFMFINQIPDVHEYNNFFNTAVMDGYQLQSLLDGFHWDCSNFYPEFNYDGREAFIHLISLKNGRDYYSSQKMEEELSCYHDIRIVNQSLVIFQSREYTRANSFEIYRLPKMEPWESKPVRYLIYITADFAAGLESVRFLELAIGQLIADPQQIDQLLDKRDLSLLIQMTKHSLRKGSYVVDGETE